MPRHQWRESFKSFLGSYIDPEKVEERRGTKAEIDDKVQKILRALKEDGNDMKETAADFIENFNSHYQSLYARYDHLIEKLRKKNQGENGKDSSSSSSDSSESDDSPRKNGKKNGQVENNSESNTAVIKQKLEMALSEVGDLKKKLTATLDEKETLYLEYQSALSKAEEAHRIICELRTEGEKWNEEKSKLLTENGDLELEVIKLNKEHKQVEIQFQNCEESHKSSEKKIEEMTDQFSRDMDAKNQEIIRLDENIEELKTELEMKDDEINTLIGNMRVTEVNQRLTSRKLLVTEQVLGEKEESHQRRVEKFLEEQKLLEEKIAAYKEAQVKMVSEVSEKVYESSTGIDNLSVKFEEDYGHLESRVYEIVNDLKVAVNWISVNNTAKDRLKKETASLVQQLKVEKEQELLLIVKIGELEMISRHDEDEKKNLIQTMKQWEDKMAEMEKMIEEREEKMGEMEMEMREKDNRILSMGEEKREAIRQLCIWIDHHHR